MIYLRKNLEKEPINISVLLLHHPNNLFGVFYKTTMPVNLEYEVACFIIIVK